MIIEEADFRMTSSTGPFWDLELLYTVRPKGKPERREFKDSGYGMTLAACIKRIIHHRMEQKQEVYTLEEYVRHYKEQTDKLDSLFKNM